MGKRKDIRIDVSVGVKMTAAERQKLTTLSQKTGLTVSATIRALLAAAETAPVESWRPVLTGGGGS